MLGRRCQRDEVAAVMRSITDASVQTRTLHADAQRVGIGIAVTRWVTAATIAE
jgi:hypothetical protein